MSKAYSNFTQELRETTDYCIDKKRKVQYDILAGITEQKEELSSILDEDASEEDLVLALDILLESALNLVEKYTVNYNEEKFTMVITDDKNEVVGTATYNVLPKTVEIFDAQSHDSLKKIKNVMDPEGAVGVVQAYFDDEFVVDEVEPPLNEDEVPTESVPLGAPAPADISPKEPPTSDDIAEKIAAEIKTTEDEEKKKLLVNLEDLIPTINRLSGGQNMKAIELLYNNIMTGADEKQNTPVDKNVMADLAYDLLKIIMNNKHLVSIIGSESKVSINSSLVLGGNVLTEAKKKQKPKNKPKKDSGISPKLSMLLRLGLVPKELYSRAKRAIESKKAVGSIAMYRNIIFDLLDEIVQYIEKDPTLYNRLRINVMKEMKNSLPKKNLLQDAYQKGKLCKKESLSMPEEYSSDYMLKSAWNRGFNEAVQPDTTQKTKKVWCTDCGGHGKNADETCSACDGKQWTMVPDGNF